MWFHDLKNSLEKKQKIKVIGILNQRRLRGLIVELTNLWKAKQMVS
jgi:hypothetical protein